MWARVWITWLNEVKKGLILLASPGVRCHVQMLVCLLLQSGRFAESWCQVWVGHGVAGLGSVSDMEFFPGSVVDPDSLWISIQEGDQGALCIDWRASKKEEEW